jgi:hypothetical protein
MTHSATAMNGFDSNLERKDFSAVYSRAPTSQQFVAENISGGDSVLPAANDRVSPRRDDACHLCATTQLVALFRQIRNWLSLSKPVR